MSAVDLFVGKALIWYRANRENFLNWEQLVEGLRDEFQPADYDERLLDEIRHRTQGPTESIGIYVSVMRNLFSRLTSKLSEAAQVKIIVKNLAPAFQHQLALIDVISVEQLTQLGRKLEAIKLSVDDYVPPARSGKALEPDLAYASVEKPTVSEITASSGNANVSGGQKCWNCGAIGHRAIRCRAPKRKHCYSCGEPGVISRNCPKCSGNGQASRR